MDAADGESLARASEALTALAEILDLQDYHFIAPTPATSQRIYDRDAGRGARSLRDVMGWSLPFAPGVIPDDVLAALHAAQAIETAPDGRFRSRLRASCVHGRLFLHSAFPTLDADAVFLGPDTYRFADFIAREIPRGEPIDTIADIGAGSGAGGILAQRYASAGRLCMTDINIRALMLAAVNARQGWSPDLAGAVRLTKTSGLEGVEETFDLIVANPPYIAGVPGSLYQDGGDLHGGRLSLEWARAGMKKLNPRGRMLLYTGSAILNGGRDQLKGALEEAVAEAGCHMDYSELDPDVFNDDLASPEYDDAERIAAVGAVITAP